MTTFDFKACHKQALELIERLNLYPRDTDALKALSENMEEYAKNVDLLQDKTIMTDLPTKDYYAMLQKNDGKYYIINSQYLLENLTDLEQAVSSVDKGWKQLISEEPNAGWLEYVCKPVPVKITISPI
jgi:hypothetical protein